MKLLLLEDDDLLGESLAETPSDKGYRVDLCGACPSLTRKTVDKTLKKIMHRK